MKPHCLGPCVASGSKVDPHMQHTECIRSALHQSQGHMPHVVSSPPRPLQDLIVLPSPTSHSRTHAACDTCSSWSRACASYGTPCPRPLPSGFHVQHGFWTSWSGHCMQYMSCRHHMLKQAPQMMDLTWGGRGISLDPG